MTIALFSPPVFFEKTIFSISQNAQTKGYIYLNIQNILRISPAIYTYFGSPKIKFSHDIKIKIIAFWNIYGFLVLVFLSSFVFNNI